MSLRLRLIVAFFLLSVVPLGAMTYYTYSNNVTAIRDAAAREAELLAGDLSQRMQAVAAQLSQRVEQVMNLAVAAQPPVVAVAPPGAVAAPASAPTPAAATVSEPPPGEPTRPEGDQLAPLGDLASLISNIEVRALRAGRGGRGRAGGGPRGGNPNDAGRGPFPGSVSGGPADTPPGVPASGLGEPPSGMARGGARGPEGPRGPGFEGRPPPTVDPSRIVIDLNQIRREMFEQIVPDRDSFERLSTDERERIAAQIEQRMQGVQLGIDVLRKELTERAAAAPPLTAAPPEDPVDPPAPAPAAVRAATIVPPTTPAAPVLVAASAAAGTRRSITLSGERVAVTVTRDGEIVGEANADLDLAKLLETVFARTARDRGEVPFAVTRDGQIFTPTPADRARIEALDTAATKPETAAGTAFVRDWIVVTTPDPTAPGLKFGIARPVGDALRQLVRAAVRDAGLGLAFIAVALIGIVPLSSRLTRDLASLSAGVNRIAQGDYGARVEVRGHDEVGRLANGFNQMAADVERHQRSIVEQERLRRELELGRQIQNDMLPRGPLTIGSTEIKGVSVPAREVGGDFFNYFPLGDGTVALLVGDVSGKGVGAALLMANLQASLRTRLLLGQDLAALANALDRDVEDSTPAPVYATLFVGIFDPVRRLLRCVNAGHNPQYVRRRDGSLERMESTGLPIGLLAGRGYAEEHVQLAAGDVLFFYTDGCVEAENAAGEMFGPERLERILRGSAGADDVLQAVEADVARFRGGVELSDDATMVVMTVG